MIRLPTVKMELSEKEFQEARKLRGDRPWREVLLKGLGIDVEPRKIGRPRKEVPQDEI